jgi:hypothetical protein
MIRTRFYHACLGWIGRNPFLTWFLDRSGELGRPFDEAMQRQREGLRVGGLHAARAFDDPRFAELGQAFDAAHHQLPAAIRRYERLMAGWSAFLDALAPLPVQDGGELDPAFDDVMPNTHGPLAG